MFALMPTAVDYNAVLAVGVFVAAAALLFPAVT